MAHIPNPFALFAVKVAGYIVAGVVLNKTFKKDVFPPFFGIIRAIAGLALGLLTIPLAAIMTPYLWLVVLRIIVWYVLIYYFFYKSSDCSQKTFRIAVLCAVVWSFVLDGMLELLSLVLPGSMEIPFC